MSDVRSLLKAKRQEVRIDHPLASYTSSGQLRCVVCETNIKHPSAWEGHLGSKAHRTNAARLREEEKRRKELELELELEEETKRLKRQLPEGYVTTENPLKRSRVSPAPQPSTSNFPSDFFSDPSQVLPSPASGSDDEDDEVEAVAMAVDKPQNLPKDSALDQEWIQFQQTVINAPDSRDAYDRATVVAEPELVSDLPEGFPTQADGARVEPEVKTDEDERRHKEQEERELIMDRLMDEERAQEEADMKVTIMKNRLEALRKKREASRSAKITSRAS